MILFTIFLWFFSPPLSVHFWGDTKYTKLGGSHLQVVFLWDAWYFSVGCLKKTNRVCKLCQISELQLIQVYDMIYMDIFGNVCHFFHRESDDGQLGWYPMFRKNTYWWCGLMFNHSVLGTMMMMIIIISIITIVNCYDEYYWWWIW